MKNSKTTRRQFLNTLTILIASSTLLHCRTSMKKQKMPNTLFLFTDDQRFDTIHALGNNEIITPNMDSLVDKGVSFTNAYIMGGLSAAVCMPSRASLLTGRSCFRIVNSGRSIPNDHITLPELFKQAGYITFGTGKWHNGKASYERSFSTGAKIMFGGMSDHYKIPHYDFDPTGKYNNESQFLSQNKHSSEIYAGAAVEFLQNYDNEKPFFMYVSFQAPHDPRDMPAKYLAMYDPEKRTLPENFLPQHAFDNGELKVRDELLASFPRTPQEIRKHIAAYYAMITHLDDQIGRILSALNKNGFEENTIIFFSSDNGLAVGQHGLMGKQNVYEHSVKVPLVICGKGVPKNERRDVLCYLWDIYPTLCDLAGLSIPNSVEGKSFAQTISDGSKKNRDAVLFAYKNFQRGLRMDQWKLICYNIRGEKRIQLFDLKSDPREINNLANDSPNSELIQKLKKQMQQLMIETGDEVDLDKPDWGVAVIPSW